MRNFQSKKKAYREANREKILNYLEANREKILKQRKAYYEANREKILNYLEANREKILKQRKAYYEANREKISKQLKAHISDLSLSYVKRILGMNNAPECLIELKRAQIKLHRAIKETQKNERKSA